MKLLTPQIKSQTWQTWMGQWAELVLSGMPMLDSLALSSAIQASGPQGRLLEAKLLRCHQYLQAGQSLQTAFRASCGVLPAPLEVALMCAQASGDLGSALHEQLNRWRTTSDATKALFKSLMYPAVVLCMAILCWMFLHQVTSAHNNATNDPPAISINAADALLALGVLMFVVAAAARWGNRRLPRERFLFPHAAWQTSSFYHVIACELQAGLDLMHCLRYRAMPQRKGFASVFQPARTQDELNQLCARIQRHLKEGLLISQAMTQAKAPEFLIRQSQLAEQTGNLSHCFFMAAKVYEMRARHAQEKLQNTLPPCALALAAATLAMAYQFTLAPLYSNLTGLS